MPPGKFLRCNSETLPFPIPEGGQEPALNWRSAGSKAGPAGQSGVGPGRESQRVKSPWRINPLDFPQAKGESLRAAGPSQALLAETSLGALGCLGKPSGHLHPFCKMEWGRRLGLAPKAFIRKASQVRRIHDRAKPVGRIMRFPPPPTFTGPPSPYLRSAPLRSVLRCRGPMRGAVPEAAARCLPRTPPARPGPTAGSLEEARARCALPGTPTSRRGARAPRPHSGGAQTLPNKTRRPDAASARGHAVSALRAHSPGGRASPLLRARGRKRRLLEAANHAPERGHLRRGDHSGWALRGEERAARHARARGRCRPGEERLGGSHVGHLCCSRSRGGERGETRSGQGAVQARGGAPGWEPRGTPVFLTEERRGARRRPSPLSQGRCIALLGTRPAAPLAFLNNALAKAGKLTKVLTSALVSQPPSGAAGSSVSSAVDSAGFIASTLAKMLTLASFLFVMAIALCLPVCPVLAVGR